jgi:hypothetical protein
MGKKVSQKNKVKSAKFPALRIRGTAPVAAAIPGCRINRLPAGWFDVTARSWRGLVLAVRAARCAGYGRQDARRYRLGAVPPDASVRNRWPFHLHQSSGKPVGIDTAIIVKMLPKYGERISTWTRMVVTWLLAVN